MNKKTDKICVSDSESKNQESKPKNIKPSKL